MEIVIVMGTSSIVTLDYEFNVILLDLTFHSPPSQSRRL